jgi:tetratricopeptide (TPR) repeat protein/CHAT domain-containing protein
MMGRSLRSAAALIVLIACSMTVGFTTAKAQRSDNFDTLNREVAQLYRAGKYAEAMDIANRALAVAEHQFGPDDARVGTALNNLAQLYQAQRRYAEAEPLFKRALAIAERALGPDHPTVGTALNNLAQLYQAQRRYAEAEPLFKRALAIAERALGPDHPTVGTRLNNLAQLYQAQRRYAEAEPLFKRALAIAEKAFGPDHSDVGIDLNNLSALYYTQGRYAEAEPLIKRALAIDEKALGPDHPEVGARLSNLAQLYRAQGRYAEAEPLIKRALAITEESLGPNHPDVGMRLNDLAVLYYTQGRYAEAEPLYERALAIAERALGPDHPMVGNRLDNLAQLYQAQGRYAEAEPLYERALAIDEKALGPDHLDVGSRLNNLAALYYAQGRYAEAEPLYKRALAIAEKALGPDHPTVGTRLDNLAELYRAQDRFAEAEPLYKRALAIAEKALGPDHSDVGVDLNNLAALYYTQGRYAEAEPLIKRALAIAEKAHGPDHPEVGARLSNLTQLYRAQGRYAEAEPLIKRALAVAEKALGPDHPDVGARLNNLAEIYEAQGRYAEAEPLYKRALAITEKALGPNHPDVGMRLNDLAVLYDTQRRYAEAEPLYKRALAITEKSLGPNNRAVGIRLNNLAELYRALGRYADAEPLYKRALAIAEKALGPDHPDVGTHLNNLAQLYQAQGRYAEAELLYKRALDIHEKGLGPDHPDVVIDLNNLAALYFEQSDWSRAADYWRRSTGVIVRRTLRGTLVGEALTGKRKSEAAQDSDKFWGLVKVAFRLSSKQPNEVSSLREMFQIAQWAQSSEAAQSLAQMATRGVKGDPKLAALIRERQDLVGEWQRRDADRSAAVAQAPEKRNRSAEAENIARLGAIDGRIADIDRELASRFPDYAALASPAPLPVEEVQKQLGTDEALVLFLDTPEWKPTPEETFIWVVTKTEVRWVRSELGRSLLTNDVAALRCGLDYQGSWTDSRCSDLLKIAYTHADHDLFGKPLPFDLARAHQLYKGLFGQIEDLIKDKRLLFVPSGSLTQLPFQVLVTALSNDVLSGEHQRDIGLLGAVLEDLAPEVRQALKLRADAGVRIVKLIEKGAAEAAGLKPDDILLAIDSEDFGSAQKAVYAVQSHAPGSKVELRVLRAGTELVVVATLGGKTVTEWIPRFLSNSESKSIAWLSREHAIGILPAVSSLRALRELAKASHASELYIGFGNPLLDGEPEKFKEDGPAAKLAREKRCEPTLRQRAASLIGLRGGTRAITRNGGGVADIADLRSWAPLPETADELCDVARDLGVDPKTHLYLGAAATETKLKQLSEDGSLAKYKIMHFATHGAIAGQVSRTAEPGLLLTPPEKASETDDGYLSASDIAGLKLDADWVILSACNTAAGGAQGAEALSGLARAFFYAGARSLLVSHWEVASDSTVKLITEAIAELKADPKIGRAEALRRSMLSLITTGKDYEAHPAVWAPFVLVGEGGAARKL